MVSRKDIFEQVYGVLRAHSFKRKGTTWRRSIDNPTQWVINFQKGKGATQKEFDLTINVGVYVNGTMGMIFGKEPDLPSEPYCFFRQRPIFFGANSNWWDFDDEHDHVKLVDEIAVFLATKVIPFLDQNNDFDKLVSYLPIEKWKKAVAFHGELLRVGVAAVILGRRETGREILEVVSADKNAWSEKANPILKEMNESNV